MPSNELPLLNLISFFQLKSEKEQKVCAEQGQSRT
jgi:hypothetical protein